LKHAPGDSRVRRADDELVPPAGARVRGAGQPGALGAQPIGVDPHSDVLEESEGQALEFRCPDPSCNGYLAWSAMLMAMIDGIQNKIDPGKPLDRDIYEMTRAEMKEMGIRTTPGSLEEARQRARAGSRVPDEGDVFTSDLIETWIDYKRTKELDPIRLRPHPHEFYLYYDN
jgi:glutamine synthetase